MTWFSWFDWLFGLKHTDITGETTGSTDTIEPISLSGSNNTIETVSLPDNTGPIETDTIEPISPKIIIIPQTPIYSIGNKPTSHTGPNPSVSVKTPKDSRRKRITT